MREIPEAVSATLITVLYAGMTAGRLLGAFLTIKVSCKKLIGIAVVVLAVVCPLSLLVKNISILYILMFIFGLTNGPVYPLMLSLTPEVVGKNISQSVIGTEIAAAYTGCVLTHLTLGILVKYFSIGILPYFVIAAYILMAVIYIPFTKSKQKQMN